MPIPGELLAGALAGLAFVGCYPGMAAPAPGASQGGEVVVDGRRVQTVDIRADCMFPEAAAVINHPQEEPGLLWSNPSGPGFPAMDELGIDVAALSINPIDFARTRRGSRADQDQERKAGRVLRGDAGPFALEQLEYAVKTLRLRGLSVGGSVAGYLRSYAARSDAVITTFPNRLGPLPKKKSTEYVSGSISIGSCSPAALSWPRPRPGGHRYRAPVLLEPHPGRSHPIDPGARCRCQGRC